MPRRDAGPALFDGQSPWRDESARKTTKTAPASMKPHRPPCWDPLNHPSRTATPFGLEKSWLQLNVSNLFDTFYFGNLSTQPQASNNPNFSVGAPRTVLGTLHIGF